jgi:C4-type Zn-finger protein
MAETKSLPHQSAPREKALHRCPKCQGLMDLAHLPPGMGHVAHRIFECSKCGYRDIMPE